MNTKLSIPRRHAVTFCCAALLALSGSGCVEPLGSDTSIDDEALTDDAEATDDAGTRAPKLRGVAANLFTGGIVHVCFDPTSVTTSQYRNFVRDAVQRQWGKSSQLQLIGWGLCDNRTTGKRIIVRFGHTVLADYVGSVRAVYLERNFNENNPATPGCAFTDTFCVQGQPPETWCRNRPQYCTQTRAVYLFGIALGFIDETSTQYPQNVYSAVDGTGSVMSPSVPPSMHRDGILSPTDIAGFQLAYGAPNPYQWIRVGSPDFPGETLAMDGGREPNGAIQRVCRAPLNGGVHPGKWTGGRCWIAWGGREYGVADAELLFPQTGVLTWRFYLDTSGPPVVGGTEANGTSLLGVCRASYAGTPHIGKRALPNGDCFIAHGGLELVYTTGYMVLTR